MTVRVLVGNTTERLLELPAGSVQTCVTSPPYYGLRSYLPDGHPDKALEIGLEETPDAYVARLVDVFREVRRVLRDDGTLWLNLGDSYAGGSSGDRNPGTVRQGAGFIQKNERRPAVAGHKPKDLLGIPWLVAFALRADGWYLRRDIIWAKPNPMPESVRDRPTSAHEYVFLLTKSARYHYDADAIAEPAEYAGEQLGIVRGQKRRAEGMGRKPSGNEIPGADADIGSTRNARSVWTIATQPYSGAHFATMPPTLAEKCIKAGSKPGDTVLDPFGGAGTTGLVADRLNRSAILCELNPEYARLARERLTADAPLLAEVDA